MKLIRVWVLRLHLILGSWWLSRQSILWGHLIWADRTRRRTRRRTRWWTTSPHLGHLIFHFDDFVEHTRNLVLVVSLGLRTPLSCDNFLGGLFTLLGVNGTPFTLLGVSGTTLTLLGVSGTTLTLLRASGTPFTLLVS